MNTPPTAHDKVELARKGAALLYENGAARVWLFGSLAKRRAPDRRSDIDLAVEGLQSHLHDRVLWQVRKLLSAHVDIVEMETATPDIRWAIVRTRILLPRPESGNTPHSEAALAEIGELDGSRHWRLFHHRVASVVGVLRERGARRIIDLGCGSGWLIEALASDPQVQAITGVDLSQEVLDEAHDRLSQRLSARDLVKVTLLQGIVTYHDPRLLGYDAAAAIEVVEHLDAPRLGAFESAVFGFARPATAVVTTPNQEYNVRLARVAAQQFRHQEHRFEWTRSEFDEWAHRIARNYGYDVALRPVGPLDRELGAPTQMATFTR